MLIPSSYCCTDDQCPAASERSPCYAQLIDIEVEPASQLSLALEQNAHLQRLERCFRNCPGYLSASLHPSEDGQHVLNYTCWRSREDCERAWQAREDAQGPLSAGVWRWGRKACVSRPSWSTPRAAEPAGADGPSQKDFCREAMSITKRYFTSLASIRS